MKTHSATVLIDRTRGLRFTESPRWRNGKLWFLDIHDRRIKAADLGGRVETAAELPFIPNVLGFRRDGSLLVGDAMQRQIHRWDGQTLQCLGDLGGITAFCLSDGIVDAQDRLYVGDIGYNFFDPALEPVDTCVIACLERDGRTRTVARDLSFPNGMVITPDGKTLIIAETMGHRLTAFDVQPDGSLTNRRVYAQLPEDVSPDGIALDAEGAVWLANPEGEFGALRVREGGEIVARVELDTECYAVMLWRADAAPLVHERLRFPRSGRDRPCAERHAAHRGGRGAGGRDAVTIPSPRLGAEFRDRQSPPARRTATRRSSPKSSRIPCSR